MNASFMCRDYVPRLVCDSAAGSWLHRRRATGTAVNTARVEKSAAAIGRRLASQLEPLPLGEDYRALTISEKDGYLLAIVQDSSGGTLIEIPAEIAPLRDLLCNVHHSASCG